MKKDCWGVLRISRTNDKSVIKKAYRGLIKEYHPDTVRAPEKIRKYTIKCVEVIHAYEEALKYAETHYLEPEISIELNHSVKVKPTQGRWEQTVFIILLALIILLIFSTPTILRFLSTWYDSMPPESLLKMIISFPLALIIAAGYHGLLSMFTTIPGIIIWGLFEKTRYEKYMYKIMFFVVAGLNFSIIYSATFIHWPFEHRVNGYYNFLYHLCRFLSWSYGPLYLLTEWIIDNLKYLRVKDSFRSDELALYIKDEA